MTAQVPTLPHNKVIEYEDFADPELVALMRDIFRHEIQHFTPEFPKGAEYRKYWEVAMSVRALRQFGALREDMKLLGVGAGTEATIFYLANHVQKVFATDLYLSAGDWGEWANWRMLVSPDRFAPYPYRCDHLVVQHMDGRLLHYPDNTFDGIFSAGSIEHFGSWQAIAASAYEMGRVLKPGGVIAISTEYRINGPSAGGWDGLRFMSSEDMQRYIVEASGLEPVDEMQTEISAATRATTMSQDDVVADFEAHLAKQKRFPRVGEVTFSRYPHIVVTQDPYTFTSVHLTLRKTANYGMAQNTWAKPSTQLIAEIDRMEASLQLGARPHKSIIDRGVKTPLRQVRKRVNRAFRR
ncbi:MAG TPA: class I SAM-dependent methyltransferase [Ktedonobacterales bacterium]|jgi:SAM-dependent methyltransferase|nr:class I SAM-dependent methyltransferase [Ktedonobacterales bacterium]